MAKLQSSLILSLIDHVSAPARGVAAAVRGLQDRMDANNRQMDVMRGRMVEAAAAGYGLVQAIKAPVQAAMEFESAMADVRKVVDFPTPQAFTDFQNALVEMSKAVPVSVIGLSEIAAAAGQAGIAGADLIRFTDAAAKIGVAFDISADQAGDAMAKLMTGLGLTIDQAILLTDSMNHLSNAQASGADEILQFVMGTASMAKGFNLSATQAAAFGSAMISAGAQVDVAKTSFQNMGAVLVAGAAATGDQNDAFEALGLNATKVAAAMQVDAQGTIIEVLERINQLPPEIRQGTIFQLFGKNADAILPLITNLDLLRESLGLVESEALYAGSSFKEFGVRAGTFQNAVQVFSNRLMAMKIVIGAALIPAINMLMERIEPLIEAVSQFAAANPELTAGLVAVAASLVAARVAAIATQFAFGGLAGGLMSISSVALKAVAGFLALVNPLNLVKNALLALRVAVIGTGIGAALVGIAMAGMFIYNNWSGLTEMFSAFGAAFMAAIGPLAPVLQPLIDGIGRLVGLFTSLTGELDGAKWTQWGAQAGLAVGAFVATAIANLQRLIAWFRALPATISAALGNLTAVGTQLMQQICDGAVAKFSEMLAWFSTWPSKILSAIGSIDVGSLIKMPGAPQAGQTYNTPRGELTMFDDARAAGGPIAGGKTYLVGEEGPELITPRSGGMVHTAGQTQAIMGGRGLGSITFGNIIIQGGASATPQELAQEFGRQLRDMFDGIQTDTGYRVA